MARRLQPVTLDFTASAPLRLVFTREMAAAPEAVYRALAEETTGWPRWFTAVASCRPAGDGRGREVRLRGGTRFRETVLAAEAPHRYAYRVDETNAPGPRALLEEWRLSPAGTGTRVRWTVAADGPVPFRLLLRVGRAGVGRAFRDAVTRLDRRLTAVERDPG
ncbi:SRPBCC family protein [Streptomyces alfalfae]|uniref:Polyketide cyclase n=1 Tax=Streptomyces alfalfae TaxID=1642299 RepID=A0A1P8TPL5_9ACTN|nr:MULTISPECIES: SRPBCC family protein [Streptomyces]AYA19975.1 SRPBCC family protein [Streptomyces fradiae]APY89533.1 polyketide cyclase [Streptomyces alfalfae]KUL61847.1 polyketide cyclase [Streptomyces sp. NRRL S-1521]QQC88028.1 SRPBCC family protein [Streptomyces alfalfae]RXX44168.1 SRPBCC family protein [Streptomyces alfalfae]